MSLSRDQAQAIAQGALQEHFRGSGAEFVIVDEQSYEEDFGWVFVYQSRRYLETKNPAHAFVGNAPIIVDRWGRVHWTGTARPVRKYIQELREKGAFRPPTPTTEGEGGPRGT